MDAHSLVSLLITPPEVPPNSNSDQNWFLSIISAKVQEYSSKCGLGITLGSDLYFDYVRCCVNALINLKFELAKSANNEPSPSNAGPGTPKPEADMLSIGQQRNVSALVEMVLALGVLPNLLPGVGISVEKRSVFLQTILKTMPERQILERYKQLVFSIESLLELARYKKFNTLIVTKHLGDVLGCLMQVAHAPLMKPKADDEEVVKQEEGNSEIKVKEEAFVMTHELFDRLSEDQERFKSELDKIIEKTYQPLIVKYLLILQSNSKNPNTKCPKWFSKTVSNLLSARLVLPDGVLHVVRGVMDLGGEEERFDWRKIGLIGNVLGNPPHGTYKETEVYYSKVCPQLLELLDSEESTVSMIACMGIKTAAERSLILGRRYLLDVLTEPFMKLTGEYKEALAVTEKELDDCIKNLVKVFVLGNDPSLMFVTHLEPIIIILLNLHMTITFGVSHLRDPVKQLVERYLKYSDKSTSLVMLRAFALDEAPVTTQNRTKMMHKDVVFAAGDEGGVKIIKKVEAEQSFYVADDEKAIVVQDLLEELKDKSLYSQFFLSLMEDLTNSMIDDDKDQIDLEFPEPVPGGDIEKQLLDLEQHLDNSMHKMRKNLMVIRLLGLLSEDKTFQENLLKESEKMIQFVTSSIKRAAAGVRNGVESSTLGVQSLNMALSILSVHLTQANVATDDWVKMQESVDDLKVLANHSDERISKISGQLHGLVCTQGIMLEEVKVLKEKTSQIKAETERMREKANEMKQMKAEQENKAMDEKKAQLKEKADEFKKQKEKRKNKAKETKSKYEEALYDISDPLLPVQGHGLIELSKLVDEKDSETLENIDKVRLIFQSNLEDEDSYIYLSSIAGLVSCGRHRPEQVLECLTKEFGLVQERKIIQEEDKEDQTMAIRTKVGEALVKITRELGEVTPKYKNILLNCFFSAANDPDPLVRASSLSNMGEVCKNLRFSLGGIAGEVLQHLAACSKDVAAEVRAAAVMVLTMILQGLGRDSFSVLQGTLRDIYRELKMLASTEKEDMVLSQVSLAVEEIDNIVREFLTPDNSIEKKIIVDSLAL